MSKFLRKSPGHSGDMPVIFVAIGTALIVLVLVALFLVVFPNKKAEKSMKQYLTYLESQRQEIMKMVEDLPKYREEIKQLDQEILDLEAGLELDRDQLKKQLTGSFLNQGFKLSEYHIGSAHAGDNAYWKGYPIDFTVTGSLNKLPDVIPKLENDVPHYVRLFEVDIKKGDKPGESQVIFWMTANAIVPKNELPPTPTAPFVSQRMPESGFFETQGILSLRDQIKTLEDEVRSFEDVAREVSTLKQLRRRRSFILAQQSEYSAEHHREWNMLKNQLKSASERAKNTDTVRIIIKVKETDVIREDKESAEEQNGQKN